MRVPMVIEVSESVDHVDLCNHWNGVYSRQTARCGGIGAQPTHSVLVLVFLNVSVSDFVESSPGLLPRQRRDRGRARASRGVPRFRRVLPVPETSK